MNGEIIVTKLAMTPGFDFGAYLERPQGSALPPTNRLLNRIRLDVHIATTPELQMQTASLRLSGDADLHLRGTAGKPVILGRADIIEGEVQFNGTKYRLERGDITFINPVTTTPVLDLQASTRVRDYDITLNLNGQIDRPNVTYRSEPPLPTSDIIGLLAFGQTSEESAQLNQSQSAFNSETSSAILSAALNATVSNRVQKLFGVSRIKIDPQGLNYGNLVHADGSGGHHRAAGKKQPHSYLHHQRSPGLAADYPGGVQHHPQRFHRGSARPEWRGQHRRAGAAAQEVAPGTGVAAGDSPARCAADARRIPSQSTRGPTAI